MFSSNTFLHRRASVIVPPRRRAGLSRLMAPIRRKVEALLPRGAFSGNSPGVVHFEGNLNLGLTTTQIELAGLLTGEFDRLEIAGHAALGGLRKR